LNFGTVPRKGGFALQSLTYFDRQQFRRLGQELDENNLDKIYLSPLASLKWIEIPEAIEDETKYLGLLGSLIAMLRNQGYLLTISHSKIKRKGKKPDFLHGILNISGARRAQDA
jgi:hypothetical protein